MWRAGVACALLGALAALASPRCPLVPSHSACHRLQCFAQLKPQLRAIGPRNVSVDGREVNVTLYWGSAPARAASALLRAQLTHVHGYRRVRLQSGPLSTAALAAYVPFQSDARYDEYVTTPILLFVTSFCPRLRTRNMSLMPAITGRQNERS
uniref:Uncharacterized protein n=1 Tax=Heliothis virescens TaxID=7102 RepID=A0A2A4J4Z1_HELVI